jgi:hypothetical protein
MKFNLKNAGNGNYVNLKTNTFGCEEERQKEF